MILHNSTEKYDYRLYCSWDMARDICICYFSSWALFSAFTPLTAGKMKISEKWKKHLEISSFCSSVPKIMIMCYSVPEIWHITHVIVIFHFGPFFKNEKKWKKKKQNTCRYHHFTQVYQNSCLCAIQFLWYDIADVIVVFWGGAFFSPLTPLTVKKNKVSKKEKWKKHHEISSFYTIVPKIFFISYTVPEIWHVTDVFGVFLFWTIFCPFPPPNSPKTQNFKKMKNEPGDIISLQKCAVLEIWRVMDAFVAFHFRLFFALLPP